MDLDDMVRRSADAQVQALRCAGLDRSPPSLEFELMVAHLVDEAIEKWRADGVRRCVHFEMPGPGFLLLGRPDHVRCPVCWMAEGRQMSGTPEDTTCDNCGEQATDGVHPVGQVCGPISVLGGLCGRCVENPARTKEHHDRA